MKMLNYIILLSIFSLILSTKSCTEGKNLCYQCNKQKSLCIKCEKKLYIPNEVGGCDLARKCIVGQNNCLQCSLEGNLCEVCENEYFPDENGGCSYTENCKVSERGRCLKCKKDYILIGFDYYLVEGIKFCKSIYSDDLKYCERINYENGLCLKCKNGYYLGTEDKKCTTISNCIESIYEVCKKCKENYYLDKSTNSCKEQNRNNSTIFIHCMVDAVKPIIVLNQIN